MAESGKAHAWKACSRMGFWVQIPVLASGFEPALFGSESHTHHTELQARSLAPSRAVKSRYSLEAGTRSPRYMESITFREPTEADVAELEELITAHFSEGSSYTVELGADDPSYHARIAESDRSILGVMAIDLFDDRAAVADEMYFFDDPDLLPAADRYGLLEMGYVRPGFTGQGIGSRLLERVEAIGIEHDIDCVLADSWYHGGPDSPESLFRGHGYETVHRDPFDRPAAECPKCEDDCVCAAGLAVRHIE